MNNKTTLAWILIKKYNFVSTIAQLYKKSRNLDIGITYINNSCFLYLFYVIFFLHETQKIYLVIYS